MTERRVYFVVTSFNGVLQFALYHDDLPTKSALAQVLGQVVYRREISGASWGAMSLSEIIAEYRRLAAAGDLPPENIAKPAPASTGGPRPLLQHRTRRKTIERREAETP